MVAQDAVKLACAQVELHKAWRDLRFGQQADLIQMVTQEFSGQRGADSGHYRCTIAHPS